MGRSPESNSGDTEGTPEMQEDAPDMSARWAFPPITEANPFRGELELEKNVIRRIRAGTSVMRIMEEGLRVTQAGADPWPADSPEAQSSSSAA